MTSSPLETARLEWRNDRTPVSKQYGDLYFSVDDGCAESHYVFMQNNDLPERMARLQQDHFTIAETGFGTGLNFLLAWHLWQQHRQQGQKLLYISAERHPLQRDDLKKSLDCWPQLAREAALLLDNYPPAVGGIHKRELPDGVTLLLLFDDAAAGFRSLLETNHPLTKDGYQGTVDAWFLDGFAPAKNPEMWSSELFCSMAKLSHAGTTFASFTAAGVVRRGLQKAGFAVTRVKGYGRKREMIRGHYMGPLTP